MILESVELKDFGGHKHVHIKNPGPVLGLIGANGSGKSTILTALEFAFTGTLPGVDKSWVRNFGLEDAPSNGWVRVIFWQNGIKGDIYRRVGKSPERKFIWNDQEPLTKSSDIEPLLAEILGADKHAVSNTIFVSQGELAKMLFGQNSERLTTASRMLLISFIEKRVDMLDKKIKSLSTGLTDYTALVDSARQARKDAEDTLKQVKAKLDSYPDMRPALELWKEFQLTQHAYRKASLELTEQKKQHESSKARLTELMSENEEAILDLGIGDGDFESLLEETLETLQSELETISDKKTELSEIKTKCSQKDSAQNTLKNATVRHNVCNINRVQAKKAALDVLGEFIDDPEDFIPIHVRKRVVEAKDTYKAYLQKTAEFEELKEKHEKEKEKFATSSDLDEKLEELKPKLDELVLVRDEASKTFFNKKMSFEVAGKAVKLASDSSACPVCSQKILKKLTEADVTSRETEMNEAAEALSGAKRKHQEMDEKVRGLEKEREDIVRSYKESMRAVLKAQSSIPKKPKEVDQTFCDRMEELLQNLSKAESEYGFATSALEDAKKAWEEVKDLEFDPAEYERVSKEHEELSKNVSTARNLQNLFRPVFSVVRNAAQDLSWHQKQHDTAEEEATSVVEKVRKNNDLGILLSHYDVDDPADVSINVQETMVKEIEGELQTQVDKRQEVFGEERQAARTLKEAKEKEERIRSRMREDAEKRSVIEALEQLKTALGRNGVPHAYMAYKFGQICELVQEQLITLDANFEVRIDEEMPMNFQFNRLDRAETYWMDQSKMSGGERVRFTVAYLLALHQLIIPEVGLMVLDEPSQHLDEAGVENLRDLLVQLQNVFAGSDNQVVVCDHHPSLIASLDNCYKLAGAGEKD